MQPNPFITELLNSLAGHISCPEQAEQDFTAKFQVIREIALASQDPVAIDAWTWLIYDFDPQPYLNQNPNLTFLAKVPVRAMNLFFGSEDGFFADQFWNRKLQVQQVMAQHILNSPMDGSGRQVYFLVNFLWRCGFYSTLCIEPLHLNEADTRQVLHLFDHQLDLFQGKVERWFISAVNRIPAEVEFLPLFKHILLGVENPGSSQGHCYADIAQKFFDLHGHDSLTAEERKALSQRLKRTLKKNLHLQQEITAMLTQIA